MPPGTRLAARAQSMLFLADLAVTSTKLLDEGRVYLDFHGLHIDSLGLPMSSSLFRAAISSHNLTGLLVADTELINAATCGARSATIAKLAHPLIHREVYGSCHWRALLAP